MGVLAIRSPEWSTDSKEIIKESTTEATVPFTSLNSEDAMPGILKGRFQVLDVRTPGEYESYHIPDSILVPIHELENRYAELNQSRETLVVCERGIRSQRACRILSEMGFKTLYNLNGGLSCYKGPKEGKRFSILKIKSYLWKIFFTIKRS